MLENLLKILKSSPSLVQTDTSDTLHLKQKVKAFHGSRDKLADWEKSQNKKRTSGVHLGPHRGFSNKINNNADFEAGYKKIRKQN